MEQEDKSTEIIRFDWAMKNILRNKENFDVLEGFLCALLEDDIKIIELIESESNQEDETDKFNRVDLISKDSKGRKIIIEIQNSYESDYLERLVHGTSKAIIESVNLGKSYKNVSKVISISILYFNIGIGDDYIYKGVTEFKSCNDGKILKLRKRDLSIIDKSEVVKLTERNIFPEYYLVQLGRYKDIVKKNIDEWIYSFKHNKVKEEFKSKNIDKLADKLRLLNYSKEEKAKYERFVMNRLIEKDIIDSSKVKGMHEAQKELFPIIEEKDKEIKEKDKKIKEKDKKIEEKDKKIKEKDKKIKEKDKVIINYVKLLHGGGKSVEEIINKTNLSKDEIFRFIKN